MILVAVVGTVIVRPNKKLNYTVYKYVSMTDDELLDYESAIPWEIHRYIDVEDVANVSCSIDCFTATMDDFMDLKRKSLKTWRHSSRRNNHHQGRGDANQFFIDSKTIGG